MHEYHVRKTFLFFPFYIMWNSKKGHLVSVRNEIHWKQDRNSQNKNQWPKRHLFLSFPSFIPTLISIYFKAFLLVAFLCPFTWLTSSSRGVLCLSTTKNLFRLYLSTLPAYAGQRSFAVNRKFTSEVISRVQNKRE